MHMQLHGLAYNLRKFRRALTTGPKPIIRVAFEAENLMKLSAETISHGRSFAFRDGKITITGQIFQDILRPTAERLQKPLPRRHETGKSRGV